MNSTGWLALGALDPVSRSNTKPANKAFTPHAERPKRGWCHPAKLRPRTNAAALAAKSIRNHSHAQSSAAHGTDLVSSRVENARLVGTSGIAEMSGVNPKQPLTGRHRGGCPRVPARVEKVDGVSIRTVSEIADARDQLAVGRKRTP